MRSGGDVCFSSGTGRRNVRKPKGCASAVQKPNAPNEEGEPLRYAGYLGATYRGTPWI